ncbi:MAG TPA: N-methyl-L-tryptophan oxidase [Puia sp.]|nr:N-methyl-L-tryptophan oxidase [Puia sp.]
MATLFDVIVLGLGANGSSALYHLSKTHKKVAGIDRFTPPHVFGSSHGESRIIRQAYYENPVYVPFIKEAYRCWEEIENASGEKLFLKTGGLMLGREDTGLIRGSRLSAETHGIAYEYLNSGDLQRRFPAFKPTADTVGVLEKEAGILFPEKCITAYLEQAQKSGATVLYNEQVLTIIPAGDKVEIHTSKGNYITEKLIISAGAWVGELVEGISMQGLAANTGSLSLPLTIARQALYWFANKNSSQQVYLQPDHFPVYLWEYLPDKMFYGFPDLGNGIKIARHHGGDPMLPDELTQEVSSSEKEDMLAIIDQYLNMEAHLNSSAVCMYTNTPDGDFIIDYHPAYKNIVIGSPCSGHGFKFSSLTGKLLSELATAGKTTMDISPFALNRFNYL